VSDLPELYLHVRKAAHFLAWERPQFAKHFTLVDAPSPSALLLSFGPDVLEEAARLPARARFAVLFPGFSFNPLRNETTRREQLALIDEHFAQAFINPGPLELAYAGASKISFYPFSIDLALVGAGRVRTRLDSLLHVSHDNPQKDWQRSEAIMTRTGLAMEVFPPRDPLELERHARALDRANRIRRLSFRAARDRLPVGYYGHRQTVATYYRHDGFVHVARDVKHPEFIDGKYTASLMEAGATGAIVFWHDSYGLGNGLETVFELPLDTRLAAERLLEIRGSLDVARHSALTREEMMDTFSPQRSVSARATRMLELV